MLCWGQQRASDGSSPEVGVLGGEDGEELVDGDAELQIPPGDEELQLVVLLPGRLQLHDPQVARNRLPSPLQIDEDPASEFSSED